MKRGSIVTSNNWAALRSLTPARIALGRAGSGLPTAELLRFGLAHARARDAVHAALDAEALAAKLRELGLLPQIVKSAAPDRETYLRRPDLGRRLAPDSAIPKSDHPYALAIEDGLSALAVERHAVPLVRALIALAPQRWVAASVAIALQGRVALGDEIGAAFGAQLVVVLIGERPGLSSPDSLGAYLTFAPRLGRTDAERNCVSNIRPEGLGIEAAARSMDWMGAAGVGWGLTGVGLKDESGGAGRSAIDRT
jgi:ethanolamine ammonia-lyase small subunit